MAVKYTNNAKSTLASGINSSVTSATVADGSIFPALGAGEYFYITFDDGSNNEIAKVTARSGNTLTIVRAQDNTTARAFSTGDSAELRIIAAVLTEIQENIAAKSANQTVYSATAASNATAYNIGVDPGVEANASVFLDGVYQHHDTFSFSGSTLTFDAAPTNGTKIEVVVDNLINLQSSNLTVDTFTATSGQTAFTLSDAPGGEANVLAFIDGVFQNQAAFTLSSNTLTFDTGVVVGRSVTVYTINPVNIGTPSDSTVTSAKLTGNITLPGSLTVGAYDVAFDSPTFFVDHTNSRVGLGTSSPSVPVDIVGETKMSSHLNLPDNAKIKVGTGGDLQLYHDGSNSYIDDAGTGSLNIRSSGLYLEKANGSEVMASFIADGAATLYHEGSTKLATAATGVAVTGTLTATGVGIGVTLETWTSDYTVLQIGGGSSLFGHTTGGGDASNFLGQNVYHNSGWKYINANEASNFQQKNGAFYFNSAASGSADATISFSTKMVIEAGGDVGIGTDNPEAPLHVNGNYPQLEVTGGDAMIAFEDTSQNDYWWMGAGYQQTGAFEIVDKGTRASQSNSVRLRVEPDGDVYIPMKLGVGVSPSKQLHISGTDVVARFTGTNSNPPQVEFEDSTGVQATIGLNTGHDFIIDTAGENVYLGANAATLGTGTFTVLSTGNVGMGTVSPADDLHILTASGDGHAFGGKNLSLTTSFNTSAQLSINLADHQACYVKVFITGDWSSHSGMAFLGEYFIQNGATGYQQPGMIIKEVDNTYGSDSIVSQIVDESSANTFDIQFKLQQSFGANTATGIMNYQIMGQFDTIT